MNRFRYLYVWLIISILILPNILIQDNLNNNAGAKNVGTIVGNTTTEHFGYSVSSAGDFNGDGIDDIIIGAPGFENNRGRVYLFFGGPDIYKSISANNANVTITGSSIGDRFGWNVSGAGDFNKDGFDDIILGAPGYSNKTGIAYFYFGNNSFQENMTTSDSDITIVGTAENDEFGTAVSDVGDVNNDGYADVLIGSPGFKNNTGAAFLLYGSNIKNNTLSSIYSDVAFTGSAPGDKFGFSVEGVGKINSDDYDDIIIGSPGADQACIYYGGDPMNAWRQTTKEDFEQADKKVHINTTNLLDGEIQLDTFYGIKGMISYFDDTPTTATPYIPRARIWNQNNWDNETNANSYGTDDNQIFVLKSGSVRKNEKILCVSDVNKDVNVQIFNGQSWGSVLDLDGILNNEKFRAFDVAYETISGDALLVYYNDSNPGSPKIIPKYRVWDGFNWSIELNTSAMGMVTVYWIALASNPNSDEIILLTLDSNEELWAQVWNGTEWGNVQKIESKTSRSDMPCFGIIYEKISNNAMIVWGGDSISNKNLRYRRWISNWSEPKGTLDACDNQINFIKLAAEPNSNYIVLGTLDNGKEIDVQIWNGTHWGITKNKITTNAERSTERCFDITWESKSDKEGLIVYGLSDHRPVCRNITGSSVGSEFYALDANPPDNGRKPNWISLISDPQTDNLMMSYLIDDGGGNGGAEDDLGTELWNGSGWTAPQRVEKNSTRDNGQHFDMVYTDTSGYFISEPFTINSSVPWGRIMWNVYIPQLTEFSVQTRTSNDGLSWSNWSDIYLNYDWITSPEAQWIQYKIWFETKDIDISPVLFDITIELNHPDVILNGTPNECFGWSVGLAGDVNGDLKPDVLVGSPFNTSSQGTVYSFFGQNWSSNTLLIASTDSDVILKGEKPGDMFGYSVSTAGKFNGDSIDDLIIGAPYANNNGSAYIFFGDFLLSGVLLSNNANQIEIGEQSNDGFGYSVGSVGDLDSRWGDECIVGAPFFDSGKDSGKTYLIMIDVIMEMLWAKTYDKNVQETNIFMVGDKITIRNKVWHAFSSDCIVNSVFTLRGPDNEIIINDQIMILEQIDSNTTSYWKISNYTFSNPTKIGEYKIEMNVFASYGSSILNTINYLSTAGPPDRITLSPDQPYLIADDISSTNITIQVYDKYGNKISGLVSQLGSSLVSGSGTLGNILAMPDDSYKIQFKSSTISHPNAIINISVGIVFKKIEIDLRPGPLHHINVTPSLIDMLAGSEQLFIASGFDINNNPVSLAGTTWTCNMGTFLNQTSTYATLKARGEVGTGYVNASLGGIIGSAQIRILPDSLAQIIVIPNMVDVTVGELQEFSAMGYDKFGNSIPINPVWTTSIGEMQNSILKAQTRVATGYVNASVSNISGSSLVTLKPANLDRIIIIPEEIAIEAGGSVVVAAKGFDKYGNELPIDPTWYSPVGEFSSSEFTAQTIVGKGVINAIYKGVIGIANITILPGELDYILISPDYVEVMVGRTMKFSALGFDRFNNSVQIAPIWHSNIGVMNGSTLTAQAQPGEGFVSASVFLVPTNIEIIDKAFVKIISDMIQGRPKIIGKIPDQIKSEDSPPWKLYLTQYESDDKDTGSSLRWYVTDNNESLYQLAGEYSDSDILTFSPKPNAFGNDRITLWLIDSDGLVTFQSIWINITPVNDKPVIYGSPDLLVHYDDPYTFNYEPYIFDIETPMPDLILSTQENTKHTYTSIQGLNITYDYPKSMLNQEVYVTLLVSDGSEIATETIIIKISDDRVPKLSRELPDITIFEGTTILNAFDLDDYFIDPDNDALFYKFGETHVTVTINLDHTVDIIAASEWSGIDTVTFRAEDPLGAIAEDTILVTVIPVNDPPTISNVPDLIVHYDYDYKFDLTSYISDNDNLTSELFVITSDANYIRFIENSPLVMVINYPERMNGLTIPVTITVFDGLAKCAQIINITVSDDFPPEIINPLPDIEFYEDNEKLNVFNLDNFFHDIDGDSIFYSYGYTNIVVTINEDNSVDLASKIDWFGYETVTFRAMDTKGALIEDTIIVIVLPVNDAPIIEPIPDQDGKVGDVWSLDLSSYIDDVDNNLTELSLTVNNEHVVISGLKLLFYSDEPDNHEILVKVTDGDKTVSETFNVKFKEGEDVVSVTLAIFWIILIIFLIMICLTLIIIKKYKGNFKIEDVFLIYNDGTLISHKTIRKVDTIDDEDILSGMLTALQDFVREGLSSNLSGKTTYSKHQLKDLKHMKNMNEWQIQQLQLGEHNILIERGKYIYLAVIFNGRAGWNLSFKIKHILSDIENGHSDLLRDWGGNMKDVKILEDFPNRILNFKF
jgi:hypothetical protein